MNGKILEPIVIRDRIKPMIVAYLESIKYVGHLWPVAIMRIIFGYQYIGMVVQRLQLGYLEHAHISERLQLSSDHIAAPGIYYELFKSLVQSQWLFMTYVLVISEILIGISYIVGGCVRFTALLGMWLSMHIYLFFDLPTSPGQLYLFFIHFLFLLLGAGRCLGIDYYFYKSRRGILW